MKNSTARKLEQIPTNYLIVGIDAHKKKHAAVIKTPDAFTRAKFKVDNSRPGFEELLERVHSQVTNTGCKGAIFAIEAGSRYWRTVAYFLEERELPFRLISPFTLKRRREGEDLDRRKNDYRDADMAAELLRTGKFTETRLPQGNYADIRAAYHTYYRLGRERSRAVNLLGALLDSLFPEFQTVFKDISTKTALAVLATYPYPHTIARMTMEKFMDTMLVKYKGQHILRKKLSAVYQAAQHSVGIHAGSGVISFELSLLVERIRLLTQHRQKAEDLIVALVEWIPESQYLLSVPGLGHLTIAGILGELGPLTHYRNAKQLIKMAGINPIQSDSADKKASHTPMSKKGRPLLRYCLWEASLNILNHNEEFKAWAKQLQQRPLHQNPLKKREARGAVCRRLLWLVFALFNKRSFYQKNYKIEAEVELVTA
jgi:transposase